MAQFIQVELALFIMIVAVICRFIKTKNNVFKILLAIAGSFILFSFLWSAYVVYDLYYIGSDVDSSTSFDGQYTVIVKSVGSPIFFSSAGGRFVLKKENEIIIKYDFDLSDGGLKLQPSILRMEWYDDSVRIIIYDSEQTHMQYDLYFDGSIQSMRLDTVYGNQNISSSTNESDTEEEETAASIFENGYLVVTDEDWYLRSKNENGYTMSSTDEDGFPKSREYQAYKKQLAAIAEYINSESDWKYHINAKGCPSIETVIEGENSSGTDFSDNEITIVRKLIWNENYKGDDSEEYVYEEFYYDADGNEAKSTAILDFYLIDTHTFEVIDENKNTW